MKNRKLGTIQTEIENIPIRCNFCFVKRVSAVRPQANKCLKRSYQLNSMTIIHPHSRNWRQWQQQKHKKKQQQLQNMPRWNRTCVPIPISLSLKQKQNKTSRKLLLSIITIFFSIRFNHNLIKFDNFSIRLAYISYYSPAFALVFYANRKFSPT